MIEIDVKLIPFGMREAERSIGKITIINDTTGTAAVGNYVYAIKHDSGEEITGELKNHKREDGIFKLLHSVLEDAI
ncbi:MAG: hypothetical protein PVG39_02300 [Desulfobacteraceae bacterium]|jgi:hypothetical protein